MDDYDIKHSLQAALDYQNNFKAHFIKDPIQNLFLLCIFIISKQNNSTHF